MEFRLENNPYTLQFSFIPPQYISRKSLTEEITLDLMKNIPAFRGHFVTGVRGSGKSVMLAEILRIMDKKDDWVTVDIENPLGDIIDALVRGLYRHSELKSLFLKAKVDISILGLGVSIENPGAVASNANDALDMMLKVLKKEGKRVLVAIDEVTYSKGIGEFSHSMSAYARAGYEIYTLMTGLKENINAIKNDKSLTFLYRAKEHVLQPLNVTAMIADYMKVLKVDRGQAEKMAWYTKGYSFAFQVLGYLYWEELCGSDEKQPDQFNIDVKFDQYLAEFVYDKIWSELSENEKRVMRGVSESDSDRVKDIRESIGMDSSEFGVYRNRLIDKGLINGSEYGHLKMILPRFEVFVKSTLGPDAV